MNHLLYLFLRIKAILPYPDDVEMLLLNTLVDKQCHDTEYMAVCFFLNTSSLLFNNQNGGGV